MVIEIAKKRIGILRGGSGEQYAKSLKQGGDIILYLHENLADKYKPVDILIDQDHLWHVNGLPVNPSDLVNKIDVAWNFSHPSFSNILQSLSIPNIGSSSFYGGLEKSKDMLRTHMRAIRIGVPRHIAYPKTAREVFEKFGAPWIVKNSNGIKLVKTFSELVGAIEGRDDTIVEEFISGKIAPLHSVSNFRGQDVYIFPMGNSFGNFSQNEKEQLNNLAKVLHGHIGAKHYLKSDFILTSRGKVYLLNIESHPDLNPDSHFSQACESAGTKMHHVIEHIINL